MDKTDALEKKFYDDSNKNFFNKKKIFFIILWLIVFIAIVALTIKFVLDIDIVTIIELIKSSYKDNKLFWLWVFLLIGFPIYNVITRIWAYNYKLKKRKIFVKWYEWLSFSLISFFIGAITPFATGSEPYIIYWLKKRGLTYKESTALVISFSILNPFVQIVITWPSFFYMCSQYGDNMANMAWKGCFWAVFVGLFFDLMGALFFVLLGYSKNAHYWINLLINKFKKMFKMKYKEKEEIKEEYKKNKEFQKVFLAEMKDWKFIISLCLMSLVWNIFYYCCIIFSFNLLDPNFSFNAFELFNYVNVSTTANNFIPIPGAEGTLQAVIVIFIKNSKDFTDIPHLDKLANGSVYIWRAFTFYITSILGAIAFIVLIGQSVRNSVVQKMKIKRNIAKNKKFTFIIKDTHNVDLLLKTLNSIRWCDYDQRCVEIILVAPTNNNSLKQRFDDIIWFDIKNIVLKNFVSNFEMIKYLIKKNLISNEYICILNSSELITYEALKKINMSLKQEDIFLGSHRRIKNNHVRRKISPYPFAFNRSIKNKNKMSITNVEMSSIYFKKSLINEELLNSKTVISNQNIVFYNLLIQKANTIKFYSDVFSYTFIKHKDYWDMNTLISLNENNNANLAIQIALLNKKLWNELKDSHYRFNTKNKLKLTNHNLINKIYLRTKWNLKSSDLK